MIEVTPAIRVAEHELKERFIRSSGPGGQNVNKVASAVQLSFDAARSDALSPAIRVRLLRLAGGRASKDGVITITAQSQRSQERNRAEARARLFALIRKAAAPPRPRKATRPPLAAKTRRLEGKKRRSETKSRRSKPILD